LTIGFSFPSAPAPAPAPASSDLRAKTINLAAICTPADYNTRPLDTIYSNFIDALPVVRTLAHPAPRQRFASPNHTPTCCAPQVKYCSENSKRLIHFSTCEVYGKTIGSFLPKDHPLRKVPAQSYTPFYLVS
jgi:UDP-apiose/xylose synthase